MSTRLAKEFRKTASKQRGWFERAAASGHPGGMRNYALVLDLGEAVPRNPKQSAESFVTAFRMGSSSARESLFKTNTLPGMRTRRLRCRNC